MRSIPKTIFIGTWPFEQQLTGKATKDLAETHFGLPRTWQRPT